MPETKPGENVPGTPWKALGDVLYPVAVHSAITRRLSVQRDVASLARYAPLPGRHAKKDGRRGRTGVDARAHTKQVTQDAEAARVHNAEQLKTFIIQ